MKKTRENFIGEDRRSSVNLNGKKAWVFEIMRLLTKPCLPSRLEESRKTQTRWSPKSSKRDILEILPFSRANWAVGHQESGEVFMWGKELLEKGLMWRVGNGESIKVYIDQWILRPTDFKPISPKQLHPNTRVSDLMSSPRVWNHNLIDQSFLPLDADLIKGLPLSTSNREDSTFGTTIKKGLFTVKNGYCVLLDTKNATNLSSSLQISKWWKELHSLEIPSKIKIFLWRASTNSLPTK